MNFQEQLRYNISPGPFYEGDDAPIPLPSEIPVNLIAYYLPQFHPIPENDEWWGEGFTEWTNVTKSLPQFTGHYQPHLPSALGFYDLRVQDVLRKQWELARNHGIGGFCFHYYWFSGKTLLDTPLRNLLSNPDIKMPFCINWANENWTRTWDGLEREVLLAQSYSPSDDIRFIEGILEITRDPRYICIGDRPLIMVYRPSLMPDPASTVRRWRDYFEKANMPDPYFVMAQIAGADDPATLGFDAAAGFPPGYFGPMLSSRLIKPVGFNDLFAGDVFPYEALVEVASAFNPTDYKIFHGICPGWDNTPRRPHRGTTFTDSTPSLYGDWLASACAKAMRDNSDAERIVFINAWNEWAEGAHLEPDRHNGFAYLRETARVLRRISQEASTERTAPASGSDGRLSARSQAANARKLTHRIRHRLASGAERVAKVLRP